MKHYLKVLVLFVMLKLSPSLIWQDLQHWWLEQRLLWVRIRAHVIKAQEEERKRREYLKQLFSKYPPT